MKPLTLGLLLLATTASAQTFAPGGAQYPSPAIGRHFLDTPVAQCVIAVPVGPNAVMLTPCPNPALPTPLPAPAPPVAAPKDADAPPPVVINIYPGSATEPPQVVMPPLPAPKALAPKAVPKKPCAC